MIKFFKFFILLLFLNNCSPTGNALLGPIITGAKTGSAYQASLSFGTNQMVVKIQETTKKTKRETMKIAKKIEDLNLEINSKDFYTSVKNLYLKDEKIKKENILLRKN
tara:strand:+ start:917 stop:1240 length:324 start_codon:yes stop_codon:yes gene_type:complete